MIQVFPFKGISPKPELAEQVASRPYDVVTREEAAALAVGNPYSFLHVVRSEVDLPADTDPYAPVVYEKARETLDSFIRDGVLVQDPEPAMYLYRLEMEEHAQVGLLCCCAVDDYDHGRIKKHEHTRRAKEDDRTRHILATHAHTGPVLMTYRGQRRIDQLVEAGIRDEPLCRVVADDGVAHTIWRTSDVELFVEAFRHVPALYIADGHHRAASAARARAERKASNSSHGGDEEYNRFLAVLFPGEQLQILAYNRVVKDLKGLTPDAFLAALEETFEITPDEPAEPGGPGIISMYLGERWYCLTLPDGVVDREDPIASLDVSILQDYLLGPILGITDPRADERVDFVGGIDGPDALMERVDSGAAAVAFNLYPVTVTQLMAIADSGQTMPPKSTWFEPKLRSGLVVHRI